jgi:putative MATE family efflux protein
MGAGPDILRVGSLYSRIMLSSSGIILLLFLINAVFRGAGDAAIAMRVLWLANFINLCLDPCLIRGLGPFPRLGVTGAAVSTSIGRSIGIVFQLYMLSRGSAHLNILRKHIRLKLKLMWNIFEVAGIGILQLLIAMASWLVMVRMIQSFGSQATAGYTVAIRIVIFSTLPSWGLGSAAATLVGQNLGAKRPDRAAQAVWRTSVYNVIFLGVLGIFFVVFATPVVRLFVHDPAVIPIAATALRTFACGNVGYAYVMVMLQAFNGAGDTLTPTIVNFFGFWVLELPLAWWLAVGLRLGANGAFLSVVIAECSIAVASIILFRQGKWARQQI